MSLLRHWSAPDRPCVLEVDRTKLTGPAVLTCPCGLYTYTVNPPQVRTWLEELKDQEAQGRAGGKVTHEVGRSGAAKEIDYWQAEETVTDSGYSIVPLRELQPGESGVEYLHDLSLTP